MTDKPMDQHSRRAFLAVAGAGAAGAAGAAMLAGAGSAVAQPSAATTKVPRQAKEPLVAYVRDAHAGEVTVYVGERHVVVHDPELAARIARAAY